MSRNYDPEFTRMSFFATINEPKSPLNANPDCCLMCSPEHKNGLFGFLNWHIQYRFDLFY